MSTFSAASLACASVSARMTATASPTWFALPCAGARVASVVRCAVRKRRMRRHLHLRAILGRDHPAANEVPDLVARKRFAGEDGKHARHFGRGGTVDRLDTGMGMGRAKEIGVALARTIHVVGVVTLARNEALVLFAAHRRTDSGCAHGSLLPG